MTELLVCDIGSIDYGEALELQERVRAARREEAITDTLLLVEHPPVFTRGRRSEPAELPMGEQWYRDRGVEIVDVRRGGKVTYHGPGQMIAYPVVRVGDVIAFVRLIERATITALRDHGVESHDRCADGRDFTGVWVQDRKIASIGLHVSGQVTAHGVAINVSNDLEPFSWVVPCGLPEVQMTSIEAETGRPAAIEAVRESFTNGFAAELGREPRAITTESLLSAIGRPAETL